jgi:hypothetical protein
MSVPAKSSDLCFKSARELATLIRNRKLSAREVMAAYLGQINRVNPKINAIVAKLDDDKCLAVADEADRLMTRRERVGPLHGLPIAFKDLEAAVGFPWTRGSRIYKDDMPTEDTVLVERLRKAGAIPIGKTNVPEFGMGSHTYNKVYGTTVNPYDLTKSAGGSSGGAGAALATGLLPLADGSDLGGSLRNPANFNNIVALRPTVGLVPTAPTAMPFLGFLVKGPMARSVADTAFLLSVMAGSDSRDPGCYPSDPTVFAKPLDRDLKDVRVAWCPDLGGLPLDRRVRGPRSPTKVFRGARLHRRGSLPGFERRGQGLSRRPHVEVLEYPRSPAREASGPDETRGGLGDRIRGKAHRPRHLRRDDPARRNHGADAPVPGEIRVHTVCCESGAAVRRQAELADGDRGKEDGELRGMDEVGLPHHRDLPSGHLRTRWVHTRGVACRHPDRGPVPRRSRRPPNGPCVRAADRLRAKAAGDRAELRSEDNRCARAS